MNRFIVVVSAVVSVFWFTPSGASTFYFESDPGDWVGQGQIRTLTDPTYTFTASLNGQGALVVNLSSASSWWTLTFAPRQGTNFAVDNYEDATRYPFQSPTTPGLDISGEGRGCNKLSGRFVVHELVFGPGSTIANFAADVEQHCEKGAPALRGAIRFNSSIPVLLTTPNAAAGTDQRVIEGDTVNLNGNNSSAGAGSSIVSYGWSQVSGPTVSIDNPSAATISFIAPAVVLGGEAVVLQLSVTNSAGTSDSDQITIRVASRSDPRTYLQMQSPFGDYIGAGRSWYYDLDDAAFVLTSSDTDELHVRLTTEGWWYLDFAAPNNTGLSERAYNGATRWPFQASTVPGLSVSGMGRGCNQLSGNFTVRQFQWNPTAPASSSLAIDFDQSCETTMPSLTGQLRVNYVDPSVPLADAGVDQSVAEGQVVTLDASQSRDSDGSISTYLWSQLSGPVVALSSASVERPTFAAPNVTGSTDETLTFQLLIVDNQGYKAVDNVAVTVTRSSAPPSPAPSASGGGGGGCTVGADRSLDPALPLLILLAAIQMIVRRARLRSCIGV